MPHRLIDISIFALSIVLMGGVTLFENPETHKWLGGALFLLWICHNIFNRHFYRNLFRGKYSGSRIAMLVVNLGIFVSGILLIASGVILSPKILDIDFGLGFSRTAHLVASHWYFTLIAIHFSFHAGMFFNRTPLFKNSAARRIAQVAVAIVSLYGIYAFILRGLPKYLFYTQRFFFFDLERGIPLFLLDYLSIFVSITGFTYAVLKILRCAKAFPHARVPLSSERPHPSGRKGFRVPSIWESQRRDTATLRHGRPSRATQGIYT